MDFFKLTDRDIRDYISDTSIYHRGRMYFFNGFVEDINMVESDGSIVAQVRRSHKYIVRISLNSRQQIENESCTCPYYMQWRKPCKHIAAVLFEVRKSLESKYNRYRNSYKAVNAVFEKLDGAKKAIGNGSREQVFLYPYLSVDSNNGIISACLEFRVGVSRPYVVKNTEEFIDAWVTGKRLAYGRQLVLDSNRQYFSGRDEAIMALLEDIYITHRELATFDTSYRYSGLIRGRQFQLMPSYLEKFLKIMTGEAIPAAMFLNDLEIVPIIEEPIPVIYEIRQMDEWLSVKLNTNEMPVELTPNGSLVWCS